jgi:hypothetical protein
MVMVGAVFLLAGLAALTALAATRRSRDLA